MQIVEHETLTCFDVIGNAVGMLAECYKYAYFYGAKGQVLTDEAMDSLIAAEPDYFKKYSEKAMKIIKDYSRGKIGLDCSGFISAITGIDNYSAGFYADSLQKTSPESGTWGNILYTTFGGTGRHIGLDIGQGRFLHMAKEGESITMGLIKLYQWEASGQIRGISYYLTGNR